MADFGADFETVQPNQLPLVATASGAAVLVVQEPDGPVNGLPVSVVLALASEALGGGSGGAVIVPGLLSALGTSTIAGSAQFIHTTGNAAVGTGGALYARTTTEVATIARKQSEDGAWWQIAESAPTVDQLGVVPGTAAVAGNGAALQAVVNWLVGNSGGALRFGVAADYTFDATVTFGTDTVGISGNGSRLNFNGVAWVNPATMPELTTNGSLASTVASSGDARAYTGWTIGTTAATTFAFSAGLASFTGNGFQMALGGSTYAAPGGDPAPYFEAGQQVVASAGQLIEVSITVANVTPCAVTANGNTSTQATLAVYFGAPVNSLGVTETLSTMAVTPEGALIIHASDFYDATSGNYDLGPFTYTTTFLVPSAQFANPFVRVQSNTTFHVIEPGLSVKVLPANAAFLITSKTQQYGDVLYAIEKLELSGAAVPVAGQLIDAFVCNSAVPYSSRVHADGVQIVGAGFRYGWYLGHGAYLGTWNKCQSAGAVAAFYTAPNSYNAGENMTIWGGTSGAPTGACLLNLGNFEWNIFGHSMDFPYQWIVGGGQVKVKASHLEKNGAQGQANLQLPMIHVTGGVTIIEDSTIQVDDNFVTTLAAPFQVDPTATLILLRNNMSGLGCAGDFLCLGGGKVRVLGTTGGAGLPPLMHANYDDGLIPDPGLAGGAISAWVWLGSEGGAGTLANVQIGRSEIAWTAAPVAIVGTLTLGSPTLTNTTQASGALAAGYVIAGAGIDNNTVVYQSNATAHTITLNKQPFQSTAGGGTQALTYQNPAVNYSVTMVLDTAVTHTDEFGTVSTASVRFDKSTGLNNTYPAQFNQLVRLEDTGTLGYRCFLKISANGAATPGSYSYIYVRPEWSDFRGLDGNGVPVRHGEWANPTTTPALESATYLEYGIRFDQVTGRRQWVFDGDVAVGSAVVQNLVGTDPAFAYNPVNWLQIGDAVGGASFAAGTVVSAIDYVHQTVTLSNAASATTPGEALVGVAAAPFTKFEWNPLTLPAPVARPDWASAVRFRFDISGPVGPISVWYAHAHATAC